MVIDMSEKPSKWQEMKEKGYDIICFYLPEELKRKFEEAIEMDGRYRSMSAALRAFVDEYIKKVLDEEKK